MPTRDPPRRLSTAAHRREQILSAATALFAESGFGGTSTLAIARAVGISQAYLFRLFATKDDLVLAVVERSNERLFALFTAAAAGAHGRAEPVLPAVGAAYAELMLDPCALRIQLYAHAEAITNTRVRDAMRASFRDLFGLVQRESGEPRERIGRFFQVGMSINVLSALGVLDLDADWSSTMRLYNGRDVATLDAETGRVAPLGG